VLEGANVTSGLKISIFVVALTACAGIYWFDDIAQIIEGRAEKVAEDQALAASKAAEARALEASRAEDEAQLKKAQAEEAELKAAAERDAEYLARKEQESHQENIRMARSGPGVRTKMFMCYAYGPYLAMAQTLSESVLGFAAAPDGSYAYGAALQNASRTMLKSGGGDCTNFMITETSGSTNFGGARQVLVLNRPKADYYLVSTEGSAGGTFTGYSVSR